MTVKWVLKHEKFGNRPWSVQAEALKRSENKNRYGYFLQQGLGKTALTLNDFATFPGADINVVLAPSTFVGDWPLAPAEWGLGDYTVGKWGDKNCDPFKWDRGVFAIAHETLRGSLTARNYLLNLLKQRNCMLTFDEATGIKNPTSLLAKFIVGEVCKYPKRTRLLDGTPIVQNVLDYYAKLRALGELNGVNMYAFRNRFAIMGGYMGKQVKGIRNEDELVEILDRCSFRALKKDWRKDMPPQVEQPIHIEMTDNQRRHYREMMEDFYTEVGGKEITANLVLTQYGKLQQISSCMVMQEGATHWLEPPSRNPKLQAIFDLFDGGSDKAIVSHIFKPSGEMLFEEFKKRGLNPARISGGMKSEDIVQEKRKFNDDTDCRVLIGQQDVTSRGHTLIGQKGRDRCFRIFYYENSLSLMHRLQMNDRNHRGEQDETCYLYDLICNPMDQIYVDILTGKREQADGMDAMVLELRKKGVLPV